MLDLCAECHKLLGCDTAHPLSGRPDACGICSGYRLLVHCHCKAAQEIALYNAALRSFVLGMRAGFIENMQNKGGWREIHYGFAARKVLEEAGELAEALIGGHSRDWHVPVMREAADLANFAMFIHSRAGAEASAARSIEARVGERLTRG